MAIMTATKLWQKAAAFAALAHRHQTRNDGRTPYFSHPVRVAFTIALEFDCPDETVLAAALLHDVIEDTTKDYDDVLEHFGREVADLVAAMSKDMRMIEAEREDAYDEQLRRADWRARLLKLADVRDNLADATSDKARRKILDKARRALELARNDVELEKARAFVQRRVDEVVAAKSSA